ncbi:MAG: TolC family protein [Deltaproteobacteria bacterium]|nr:TolC family protein [Deltaproteobacteria bacterium]
MRHATCILLTLFLSLGSSLPTRAAPSSPHPTAISLFWAIERALAQHPRIRAKAEAADAATHHVRTTGLLPDPMAMVTLDRSQSPSDEWMVRLTQSIPFPGKLIFERKMAHQAANRAKARHLESLVDLRAAVQEAFFTVHFIDQQLAIEQENQRLFDHFSATAEVRYATGDALFGDPLKARVEAEAMAARVAELRLTREAVAEELAYLLDLPSGTPIRLAAPRGPVAPAMTQDDYVAYARANHPRLRAAAAAVGEAEAGIGYAKAHFGPDITTEASYHTMTEAVSGSVGLSFPLYFGRQRGMVAEARAKWRSEQALEDDLEQQLSAHIRQFYRKMTAARRVATEYQQSIIPRADATIRAAETAYQAKKVEFLTLVDAIREKRDFQIRYWEARTEYELMRARLEQLAGIAQ